MIDDEKISGLNVNSGYPYANHFCIPITYMTYIRGFDQ